MKPAPFSTTPEDVADVVAGAVVNGAETVYAPRLLRPMFAGLRLAPRALFRRLPL
jgi:hypothetical protein